MTFFPSPFFINLFLEQNNVLRPEEKTLEPQEWKTATSQNVFTGEL